MVYRCSSKSLLAYSKATDTSKNNISAETLKSPSFSLKKIHNKPSQGSSIFLVSVSSTYSYDEDDRDGVLAMTCPVPLSAVRSLHI